MSDPAEPPPEDSTDDPSVSRIIRDTLVFTIVIVGAVAAAGYVLREPLTEVADWLIATMGVGGMFIGVFVADAFTVPIPPDFYLIISIASGFDPGLTIATCAVGSVVAGNVAYLIGPQIERIPILESRLQDFRPRGERLFGEWGGWAVAVAAMTPVPFSIVSWLAGIYGMSWRLFWLASLVRIPRIAGYYLLYKIGWVPSVL
jgi:membrane protein YqaA with SNARE-associated domain